MAPESSFPPDPIAAVTHPTHIRSMPGWSPNDRFIATSALGVWVAASAEAVTAVLASDLCRVRPPAEPVPRALVGSPAGEIFRHLVRMNDGPAMPPANHGRGHPGILRRGAGGRGEPRMGALPDAAGGGSRRGLAGFSFRLPVYTVASLLGVPRTELRRVSSWTGDLVAAFAPASTAAQVERGQAAASFLLELFRALGPGDGRGDRRQPDRPARPVPRRHGRPDR